MLHHIFNSGFYNTTFWFAFAVALALVLRIPLRRHRLVFALLFFALSLGTLGNLCLSLYRAYSVPRDIMQDITSASEFLEGRPLYPDDMTRRINDTLAKEGPRGSLLERWPGLRDRERAQFHEMATSHWVQAHPPFMTLCTAPFVQWLGILGTQIAFVLISVLALALTLYLIRIELFPEWDGWSAALVGIAILGWEPVLTVLRAGQSGLLLGALLTSSWFLLRRNRPGWAGIAAGVAVSLKLVPGLILLVLLMRHRRAFLSAIMTIASIALFVLGMTSVRDHLDYFNTSRGIVEMYAAYSGNLSLLGTLARGLRDLSLPFPLARGLWLVCGLALAAAFAWQMKYRPTRGREKIGTDVEFALAMTLMPLLSPVSWDHYLVFLILPLAVLGSRVISQGTRLTRLRYSALLLFFAIPDSAFLWTFDLCTAADCHGLGIWLALTQRMLGMGILTMWLSRWLAREPDAAVSRRAC